MLAARIGLAGAIERNHDEDPLADVVLALSASTAAVLAVLDAAAGAGPFIAVPAVLILAGHVLRRRRVGLLAALPVWVRVLGLSGAGGFLAPLLMLGLCLVTFIGPGRVLDWMEVWWEARGERIRREREAAVIDAARVDGIEAIGWIEELPDGDEAR